MTDTLNAARWLAEQWLKEHEPRSFGTGIPCQCTYCGYARQILAGDGVKVFAEDSRVARMWQHSYVTFLWNGKYMHEFYDGSWKLCRGGSESDCMDCPECHELPPSASAEFLKLHPLPKEGA